VIAWEGILPGWKALLGKVRMRGESISGSQREMGK
jgi:hypothetical protein